MLKIYFKSESIQTLVLDELDFTRCDKKIIESIGNDFNFSSSIRDAICSLETVWLTGHFVGKGAGERGQEMARLLSACIGTYDFWLRIIVLYVFSTKRGLNSNLFINSGSSEYRRFCNYYSSTDYRFQNFQVRTETLREYTQMDVYV